MEREKSILETSEVLQEVMSDFKNNGFLICFKISYGRAAVLFDLFWEQSKPNAVFSSAFNAYARMKFIEQFLEEAEVILSDTVRFRLRDYYKDAAVKLVKNLTKKDINEFISESDIIKEAKSRFKYICSELGDSERDEKLKEIKAELRRFQKNKDQINEE